MDGYEELAIKILACAVRDYKAINKQFMRASPAVKAKLLKEKKDIEKFLLSEKFNITDMSGERLLELAQNKDNPMYEIDD